MNLLLALAAFAEAVTGLALVIVPALVIRWLFGADVTGIGFVACRLAGIALISLGIACWPRQSSAGAHQGMFIYNLLATVYLGWVGVATEWRGVLLWPAVVLHASLTLLLARYLFKRGSR
jgi:hypothetical protein